MPKKYFWLKLHEDFFQEDTISWVEEQPNGMEYVNFYLKLCLKSLRTDGALIRIVGETIVPYSPEKLSEITKVSIDTVKVAMDLFVKIGLVEIKETGEIQMKQFAELVGSETDSAKRMRHHRAKTLQVASHCDNDVQKCDTEIEKDIEQETYTEQEQNDSASVIITRIIKHWNTKSNLPHCPYLSATLPKIREVTEKLNIFKLDELTKAIDNLSELYELEEAKFRPSSLQNFIVNSIDRWIDSANPQARYKKPEEIKKTKEYYTEGWGE